MKKDGIALSSFIASVVAVLIIVFMAAKEQRGFIAYFVAIVVYIAVFAVVSFIARNLQIGISKYVYYVLIIGAMIAGVDFLIQTRANSGSATDLWTNYPNIINVFGLIAIITFSMQILIKSTGKINLWPVYILASVMYGFNRYAPNILSEDYFDIDAYVYSIYNVYYGTPYTWETRGNYGHYGLFFKIPMMIFGSRYVVLTAMIAAIAGFVMLCYCFAIDRLINNSYIKILVLFAALADPFYMNTSCYYQTAPNRYVFIMMMMAWIAHCHTKPWKFDAIIGGVMSSLAILWNLESGVAVACGWCVYQMIAYYQKNEKIVSLEIVKDILLIPVEFVVAMLIVGLYNISCGASPDFLTFFYPVWTAPTTAQVTGASASGIVAAANGNTGVGAIATTFVAVASGIQGTVTFSLPIKVGNYSYIYFVPLLLTAFVVPFIRIKLLKLESSVVEVLAPLATMGIIMYSYYMNRFYELNAWIAIYEIVLIAGIIVDTSVPDIREFILQRKIKNSLYVDLKSTVSIILVMGLSMIAFVGVCGIQQQSYLSLYANKQNNAETHSYIDQIAAVVPENTFAVGVGTVELYSMLGWDTGNHKMDYQDCGGDDLTALYDEIYASDEVFLNQEVTWCYTGGDPEIFMETGNFETIQTFEFGDQTYVYLRKKQ